MELKRIIFNQKTFSDDFLISDSKSDIVIVYFEENKYYPINAGTKTISLKNEINALIFREIEKAISFYLDIKGLDNLKWIELTRLLKIKKNFKLHIIPDFVDKYERYLTLLNLEDPVTRFMEDGLIFPEIALLLLNFERKDAFLKILENFKLTFSEQKEVFNYLKDSNKEIEFEKIKTKEELLKYIRKKIYPDYSENLENFKRLKNKLSLPKKILLKETPFFEKKDLKLEITFKTFDELLRKIDELNKNLKDKEKLWKELLKSI